KSIPEETILQLKSQVGYNTQVTGRSDFLTYRGGGFDYWGDSHNREVQPIGQNWTGAAGVSRDDAPINYKWSASGGGKLEDDGVKVGGFASLFYQRNASFYDNGINDSLWVVHPGDPMTPQTLQGTPNPDGTGDFKTALFDVTQGTQSVQWGRLGTFGVQT